jgi:hypothetical protein
MLIAWRSSVNYTTGCSPISTPLTAIWVTPPESFVEAYAKRPDRHVERVSLASKFAGSLGRDFWYEEVRESHVDYLSRLGWIRTMSAGVELTSLGRALLKALNAPVIQDTADVFEIVLDPDDPFAYAKAVGRLASVDDALLVEPYFRLDQLIDVAELSNVTRVLVGSALKPREYEALSVGLGTLEHPLEIRKAVSLHDRYLIPGRKGQALMLGVSLGGIGKKISTLTPLGEVATDALREAYERIWHDAEIIPVKVRAEGTKPEDLLPAEAPAELSAGAPLDPE